MHWFGNHMSRHLSDLIFWRTQVYKLLHQVTDLHHSFNDIHRYTLCWMEGSSAILHFVDDLHSAQNCSINDSHALKITTMGWPCINRLSPLTNFQHPACHYFLAIFVSTWQFNQCKSSSLLINALLYDGLTNINTWNKANMKSWRKGGISFYIILLWALWFHKSDQYWIFICSDLLFCLNLMIPMLLWGLGNNHLLFGTLLKLWLSHFPQYFHQI